MSVHKYLIGIGGSGAKAVEAFLHLKAAGYGNPGNPTHLAVIDPDGSNWNLQTMYQTLLKYRDVQKILQIDNNSKDESFPLFGTRFEIQEKRSGSSDDIGSMVWSPVEHEDASLNLIFAQDRITDIEGQLFKTLYTEEEMTEKLKYGFKGHPGIGSLLISKEFRPELDPEDIDRIPERDRDRVSYWSRLLGKQSRINNIIADGSDEVRIMIVGSIFGGTGAAGVPTIVKKIHNLYSEAIQDGRIKLGLILLLPYFKFIRSSSGMQDGQLYAEADDFILNSRYALRYYKEAGLTDYVNSIYVLGDNHYEDMDFAVGGSEQKNKALIAETLAAVAVDHFYNAGIENNKNLFYANRGGTVDMDETGQKVDIKEIPYGDELRKAMLDMVRFGIVYNKFSALMKEITANFKLRQQHPWSTGYFRELKSNWRHKASDADRNRVRDEMAVIESYLDRYLDWTDDITDRLNILNRTKMRDMRQTTAEFNLGDLVGDDSEKLTWRDIQMKVRDTGGKGREKGINQLCKAIYDIVRLS
ncbi:MAG TPA: hypothetical protein GXZ29_05015 [Clostridiales bacterium]|jgi:hypothetical protein|nr:hypothetical protein [Clostridiales bacterium]